ncbi:MAG: DNA glycosylase AlkZ-like family protein, partial [Acidimicrobiales bacterium]
MWAVPADLVPVVAAACGRAIAAAERRRLVAAIESQGLAEDGTRFVAGLEERALAALAEHGEALSTGLTGLVPGLERTVRLGGESRWAVDATLGSRMVVLLTCEGRVVRTRPLGGWTSTRNRYAVAPATEPWDTAEAQAELARRWLAAFGPLSDDPVADLSWWAGWTVGATRKALAAAGEVPAAPAKSRADHPWAALVPSLDPSTMGWRRRDWYLGELGPQLFDTNGNAGPTIWCDGHLVGGWAHRPTGEVVTRLLVDVGRQGAATVEAEADRLQAWLDASGARVRPRFPTPLQKELVA